MKNRLSYMNSSKFQEIIAHVLPLAKTIRNYWTIQRESKATAHAQKVGASLIITGEVKILQRGVEKNFKSKKKQKIENFD